MRNKNKFALISDYEDYQEYKCLKCLENFITYYDYNYCPLCGVEFVGQYVKKKYRIPEPIMPTLWLEFYEGGRWKKLHYFRLHYLCEGGHKDLAQTIKAYSNERLRINISRGDGQNNIREFRKV